MTSKSKVGLSKRREFLVYSVILVIAGGSIFDIVNDTEHWPFSPYPMFSGVRRDYSLTKLQLIGVTGSDPPREIPLSEPTYIQPLSNLRLSTALKRNPRNATRKQYLDEALRYILVRYEALRHEGRHDGPPLRGIRLYQYYWKLDPWARNADQPDHRELILETMTSTKR